jgi:glycosyltransferase involved in cell wall biosynthesis
VIAPAGRPPLVTVCIPTIGRTELVNQTWQSLQRQTFRDVEIIILDNASEPSARDALAAMAASDPRARVLRVEERVPVFTNFERGRAVARGRYLVYFHDDDVYEPDFLERNVEMHERAGDLAFSGCNCAYIDPDSRPIGTRELVPATEIWPGRRYIETLIRLGRNPVGFQGIVFRASAVRPGLFTDANGPHYTDFVMLMRLAESANVGMIAERLVRVRRHPEQGAAAIRPSRGFPLMARVLGSYLDDLEARGAADAAFVARLRRSLRQAVQRALVLGWLQADSAAEADACRRAMGGALVWRGARMSLGALDRIGARERIQRRVLPTLKSWLRKA